MNAERIYDLILSVSLRLRASLRNSRRPDAARSGSQIARSLEQSTQRRRNSESGYAFLFALGLILLMIAGSVVVMQKGATIRRREMEQETIWRGNQYARAIRLYYHKTGHYPQTLDDLQKGAPDLHFLRQPYKLSAAPATPTCNRWLSWTPMVASCPRCKVSPVNLANPSPAFPIPVPVRRPTLLRRLQRSAIPTVYRPPLPRPALRGRPPPEILRPTLRIPSPRRDKLLRTSQAP